MYFLSRIRLKEQIAHHSNFKFASPLFLINNFQTGIGLEIRHLALQQQLQTFLYGKKRKCDFTSKVLFYKFSIPLILILIKL